MKRIAVFGNYSGRNAGDNALLEGLLADITAADSNVEFRIPTINPAFITRTYGRFRVRPVGLLPWHGAVKILGWPTLRTALTADLILVTDAILFDRHLWNPLHNYLHTLSWVLPLAASRGVPVVTYNSHLGPLISPAGRRAMRRLVKCCSLLILRDEDSLGLLEELGESRSDVILGADCALGVAPCSEERFQEIARRENILQSGRPLLTATFSAYLGTMPGKPPTDRKQFVHSSAAMLDTLLERLDVELVLVSSHYMDLSMNRDIRNSMQHSHRVSVLSNRVYSHNDLAGLLQRSEMHVSMRTHPMIFASSSAVPVVSIDANPKNASFLRSIGQDDKRVGIHDDILSGRAAHGIETFWEMRAATRAELSAVMPREKEKARSAAGHLLPYLAEAAQQVPSRPKA